MIAPEPPDRGRHRILDLIADGGGNAPELFDIDRRIAAAAPGHRYIDLMRSASREEPSADEVAAAVVATGAVSGEDALRWVNLVRSGQGEVPGPYSVRGAH